MLLQDEIRKVALQLRDSHAVATKSQRFIYQGDSMRPLFAAGDCLTAKTTQEKNLHFGDLIVYKKKEYYIVHRFLGRVRGSSGAIQIVTKADNSHETDNPFDPSFLVGKVIQINREGKQLRLDTIYWRTVFCLAAAVSYLEAFIFSGALKFRRNVLRMFKFNQNAKHKTAKLIKAPKAIFLKIAFFLSTKRTN